MNTRIGIWRLAAPWRLAFVLALIAPATATATKENTSPRTTIILESSGRFLAQDSWKGVALYKISDLSLIRSFRAKESVCTFDVTRDEAVVLLGCGDGSLAAWELTSGKLLWEFSPAKSGLRYVYDVCFAADGKSVIVCDLQDQALIFESRTGRRIGAVSFPPGQTTIFSAALSPDGSRAVVLGDGSMHVFDTRTGALTNTGVNGYRPVRYSLDGKYIALGGGTSEDDGRLRIVNADDKWAVRDLGRLGHIEHIKPVEGGFIATSSLKWNALYAGVRCWSESGKIQEVWRLPGYSLNKTDFTTKDLIGVWTDFRLKTQVLNLRTGAVLRSIDNSRHNRWEAESRNSSRIDSENEVANESTPAGKEQSGQPIWLWPVVAVCVLSLAAALWRYRAPR
jgi:WD40 repeat protein